MKTKQQKCSDSQKNRIVIHRGEEELRIYSNELDKYLSKGWLKGFSDSHRKNNGNARKGIPSKKKGIPLSEETKNKLSNSLKGRTVWNKGLTIEDPRVKKGNDAMIKTRTKNNTYKNSNNMNQEHKDKISKAKKGKPGKKLSPEKLKIKLSKDYLTKKRNNTFNTSTPEEKLYEQLLNENKSKTIYRQYKDEERYPFYCDFYIVEDDLFIELNAHWTHGGRPYDEKDEFCINQLAVWKEKAKMSKFYQQAIETWTIRDVKKAKFAKENNLNYKVIY